MKILWVVNGLPREMKEKHQVYTYDMASWIVALISNLRLSKNLIEVLFPLTKAGAITIVEENVRYRGFLEHELASFVEEQLTISDYDVIHLWGLEYRYMDDIISFLSEKQFLDRTILSVQGICTYVGKHYCDGLPSAIVKRRTIRDLIKNDSLLKQKKRFMNRGEMECQLVEKLRNISGRTEFDYAFVNGIADVKYYHCMEGLRKGFYQHMWELDKCKKNRIFISQGYYPIKGLHILLEAVNMLQKDFADIEIAVAGILPIPEKKYKDTAYAKYLRKLIRQYQLKNKINFLGLLNEEEIIQEYLKCNVFVMPSTIENSPNSVAEAMMLGVPVVASNVGGVSDLIRHAETGFLYQWNAPYMLAHFLKQVLNNPQTGKRVGDNARRVAVERYDIEKIIERWDCIYGEIRETDNEE